MNRKSIVALFLAFLLIFSLSCSSFASNEDPEKWKDEKSHNRWTQAMVFGNPAFDSYKDEFTQQKIKILQDAILLCIDQYNFHYSEKLDFLKSKNISGIPDSIDAINFTAGTNHRAYTHRGWNHKYTDFELNTGHADIRKDILRNTVEYIFHFDYYFSSPEQADKVRNAMCCLLYITHILGDRFHSKKYYGNVSTLILADDSKASETVINDLRECLPILFPNQKSKVKELDRKLAQYSQEIVRRHRQEPENWLEIDREYAVLIKDLLKESLPDLLKQQDWFTSAFPLYNWNGT